MIFERVIASLAIPDDARVDRRVPKKLLVEQGAPTAGDKRQIQDGIEEITWIAALKPTNIAVPAFRDDIREYIEIAVVTVDFRATAKPTRIVELTHRAIPYPLLLLASHGGTVSLSLAHKRWSHGEKGKIVVEDVYHTIPSRADTPTAQEESFLASLAISRLPSQDLFALYQAWIDCVTAFEASHVTGTFALPTSTEQASILRDNLNAHSDLKDKLSALRTQAKKEKQMKRRVEINLEIKRLESELAAARAAL